MNRPMFKDFISGKKRQSPQKVHDNEEAYSDLFENKKINSTFRFNNFMLLAVSLFILFVGLFYLSIVYNSAIVKVTPVKEGVVLNDIFTASLDGSLGSDSVPFKIMRVEGNEITAIPAQGSENVSRKASGEIVVYNDFSTSPQKLIAGTRFETPDGKIYKIDKPILIPGKKVVDGKSIPGSLVITVYASVPGSEYNAGPSDFTIPGLKGGPRFKSVYGRGKGDITGGFVGEVKIVSSSDVLTAKKKAEDSLTLKLVERAKKQVPSGYILFDDASFLKFEDNSSDLGQRINGSKVNLLTKGSLNAAIFSEKDLSRFIARKKILNLKNYDVHSSDLKDLAFKIVAKDSINIETNKSFSFRMTGSLQLVWDFNSSEFAQSLAGLSKDKYQEVFKKYPMVEKAETVFKPSWSRSFPESVDGIVVQILEN